ncbi:hypothetical protein [Agrobacterium pusense]|uniref:hypothetical protein n=1 Tax=Agrobacterium pusense TaxID=648995 RepID=UPI000664616E|nr:hypothetical protein [Agrobacterium pusense]
MPTHRSQLESITAIGNDGYIAKSMAFIVRILPCPAMETGEGVPTKKKGHTTEIARPILFNSIHIETGDLAMDA